MVTDALEMKGAAATAGGIPQARCARWRAGADLLCIGAEVDRALVEAVAAEIVAAVGDGRLPHDRLVDAVTRTAKMASWTATPRSMPEPDAGLGVAAARRAVRVEGSLADLGSPLVVQLVSRPPIAEGRVPWGLAPHLDGTEQVEVVAAEASPEALADRAGTRPIVVVGRHTHRLPASRSLIERLAAAARRRRGGDGLAVRLAAGARPGLRHHARREPRQRPRGRGGARPLPLSPSERQPLRRLPLSSHHLNMFK